MPASAFFDRVLETTTTTGTGTLTLAGAVTGYQSFAAIGNGNTTPMAVWEVDANGNPSGAWEVATVCVYTASGTTLTRGVFQSSSTGSPISFGAGTKRVAQTLPAVLLNALAVFDVTSYGAVGDGVTDDTDAISAAIDDAADGNGHVFFPPGTYLIAAYAIPVWANVRLRGSGVGVTTLKRADSTTAIALLYAQSVANVVIEDLSIDGNYANNPTGADQEILINDCTHVLIRNIEIVDPRNIGIGVFVSTDVQVLRSRFVGAGVTAVSLVGVFIPADNVACVVDGCYFAEHSLNGVTAAGCRVSDSAFNHNAFDAPGGQIYLAGPDAIALGNLIENGGVAANTSVGIEMGGGTVAVGNIIRDESAQGIHLAAAGGQVVVGNRIEDCLLGVTGGAGIYVEPNAAGFTIHDNRISDAGGNMGNGIAVASGTSDNYSISGNVITGSTGAPILDSGSGTTKFVEHGGALLVKTVNGLTITPSTGTVTIGAATFTTPASASNAVIPDAGSANNFLTAISSGGVISKAQPAFTNLSGLLGVAQLPAALAKTHIAGLELSWVSASAIDILIGSAYVESTASIVDVTATISLTSLSLGNSAWGYVYLKSDGTAECNTTAPAAPYAGSARSKTSDTSRRFLGAVRTDASGNIYRFRHWPTTGLFRYQAVNTEASPFRILSGGTATTSTAVSAAAVVPPQSRSVYLRAYQVATTGGLYYGSAAYTVTTTVNEGFVQAAIATFYASLISFIGCDSSQQINYLNGAASGAAYFDVHGYLLER